MAETPDKQRFVRPRPGWEGRLDHIDDRLDGLASQLEQVIDAVASEREGRLTQPPQPDVSPALAILSDQVSDTALDTAVNREVLQRLDGLVGGLIDSMSRLESSLEAVRGLVDGLRSTILNRDSADVAVGAIAGLADQVRSIDRRLVSRADIADVRQRVEQAEVALAHQSNIIGEALRRRVDDQRILSGELGAQLANLSASVSDSVDLPDKVRREIRKEVSELAEHLGVAMRDMRMQLAEGSDSTSMPALTTGLERISGRIQADTQRLSKTVSSAQSANDERMRRLDAQVTELRQRLELLRLSQPLASRQRDDR